MRVDILLWTLSYSLEERRQSHAAARHLWKQAGCRIALELLRIAERLNK